MKKFIAAVLILGVVGCTGYRRIKVVRDSMPAVVHIAVVGENRVFGVSLGTATYTGTGVAISKSGHILTCAHLVDQGQTEVVIELSGSTQTYVGKVLSVDQSVDLALIRIDAPTPKYVKLARRYTTQVGQDVVVIGNPLGLKWTVTAGIVSAFRYDGILMQLDADINPGNSGGPVFNLNGELIGIANAMYTPTGASIGLNFAVSTETIHDFLAQFRGL